ncbi:hypothetical protein BCR44DRAFT_1426704 [Catenaria anguillulae PL171]|uniref:P-loop containing nucleoside triphosphate hydrolase protein n=1 Tax=Catenaria anguillulae PL171 TaxID=765915 RepID=A0A1Y2I290_9FUNG|nr:hypothetical protein BCR44DRAFT_1426704 [Catenaria anguillulae PL171]
MISKLKAHTSVLLVTHDMDEAERLAERAGILINGSLVCLGSPHRLKSLLGSAYLLKLQFGTTDTDGSLADRVLDDVEHKSKELIAGSRARVMYRGQSRIEVAVEKGPASFVDEEGKFVGNLLKFVASQRYMWRVSDWSLGEVSLGELFVRFARQHRAYQEEEL